MSLNLMCKPVGIQKKNRSHYSHVPPQSKIEKHDNGCCLIKTKTV